MMMSDDFNCMIYRHSYYIFLYIYLFHIRVIFRRKVVGIVHLNLTSP